MSASSGQAGAKRPAGRKSRRAHKVPFSIDVCAPDLRHACALQRPSRPRSQGHRDHRGSNLTARLKSGAHTRGLNGPSPARRDFRPTGAHASRLLIRAIFEPRRVAEDGVLLSPDNAKAYTLKVSYLLRQPNRRPKMPPTLPFPSTNFRSPQKFTNQQRIIR
jgi:hypothetical protein